MNRCQGIRNFFQSNPTTIGQVQIELQQIESQSPEQNTSSNNLLLRETEETAGNKSVVLVIHHHEEPQNTLYSCQMQ